MFIFQIITLFSPPFSISVKILTKMATATQLGKGIQYHLFSTKQCGALISLSSRHYSNSYINQVDDMPPPPGWPLQHLSEAPATPTGCQYGHNSAKYTESYYSSTTLAPIKPDMGM